MSDSLLRLAQVTRDEIVFRHGGRIWAEAGIGASFFYTLAVGSYNPPHPPLRFPA